MRVAFHVHSDWSYDGKLSLPDISQLFSRRGYDAVMLCEHCRTFNQPRWIEYQAACKNASTHAWLLPGIEYSDPENIVHIPTWGLADFVGPEVPTQDVLDRVAEHQAFAVFAHPERRNAWKRFKPEWTKAIACYEYWNRKTDGFAPSPRWRDMESFGLKPLLALDYHSDRQRMPFGLYLDGEIGDADHLRLALRDDRFEQRILGAPIGMTRIAASRAALRTVESGKRLLRRRRARKSAG